MCDLDGNTLDTEEMMTILRNGDNTAIKKVFSSFMHKIDTDEDLAKSILKQIMKAHPRFFKKK